MGNLSKNPWLIVVLLAAVFLATLVALRAIEAINPTSADPREVDVLLRLERESAERRWRWHSAEEHREWIGEHREWIESLKSKASRAPKNYVGCEDTH
ncbi:hypothetical protein ACYOEI_05120 [Singulisphaera rosea]